MDELRNGVYEVAEPPNDIALPDGWWAGCMIWIIGLAAVGLAIWYAVAILRGWIS